MNGFVIAMLPDDEDSSVIYWTQNEVGLEDLNEAHLYTDLASARLKIGEIQTAYTSYSVSAIPASKGIVLKHHVAASPASPTVTSPT